MANSVNFDTAGFFNSIMPLNQTNWASYFYPSIPDGVLAGIDDEMEVYGNSSGMFVYVKSGECRVRSHRGVLSNPATLDITTSDSTYDRKDLVVARVTYGNPSVMTVRVKTGTPAASPSAPSVTQTAGSTWEIPLAVVNVQHGAVTITANDVEDRRYIYSGIEIIPVKFTTSTLTVENHRRYQYNSSTALNSLTIDLPKNIDSPWSCEVDFPTSSSFSGVVFRQGGSDYTVFTDSDLKLKSTRYHLELVWNGYNVFAIAHTNEGKPIESFTSASIVLTDKRWYRNTSSDLSSLTVTLPNNPPADWHASVDFRADTSFSGMTFVLANGTTPTILTDSDLKLQNTYYHVEIFWTGTHYRVVAYPNSGVQTAQGKPIVSFTGATVTVEQNREHRNTTAANSMTITLPSSPNSDFISAVRFLSSSSFTGTTVKKGTTTISGTTNLKLKGDALNLKSKAYYLIFWWDGTYYWCASAAAA